MSYIVFGIIPSFTSGSLKQAILKWYTWTTTDDIISTATTYWTSLESDQQYGSFFKNKGLTSEFKKDCMIWCQFCKERITLVDSRSFSRKI